MLVRSGYARPGQTSVGLLNSFDLGMLLDVAYELITERMDAKQLADLQEQLAPSAVVYDLRRERIARNMAALAGHRKKR